MSSEVKHTPEPWMAAASPSSVVGWPIVAQSGRLICSMATPPKQISRIGKEAERYDEFMAEVQANARLIAAAPDMLAALKAFIAAIDRAIASDDVSIVDEITDEIEDAARAAISKAEGRTP